MHPHSIIFIGCLHSIHVLLFYIVLRRPRRDESFFSQVIVAGSKDDISTLKLYEHLLYDLRNWKSKSLYACLKFLIFH